MPTCASGRSSRTSKTRASANATRGRRDIRAQVARLKEKALAAGGLFVLGTERHESRRIDNQLRGRSGRQGDPGHSKFFLSLEDDLMRIFGTDKLDTMLQRLGLKENEAIVHSWINKALEKAQQKVEARNFDIRKNLLKFDNVMNDQRKVIFDQRVEWMKDEAVNEIVADMRHAAIDDLVAKHVPENAYPEQWDTKGLQEELKRMLDLDLPVDEWAKEEGIADEELLSRLDRRADEHMASKVAQWGADVMRYVEKIDPAADARPPLARALVMLEHLRQVIGLRGYGQRDPLNEYKAEAFNLFEAMSTDLREAVTVAAHARRDQDGAAAGRAGEPSLYGGAQDRPIDRRGRDGAGAGRRGDARASRQSLRLRRSSATRMIPQAGARSAATRAAPAAPARSTSTATAGLLERETDDGRHRTKRGSPGLASVRESLSLIYDFGQALLGRRIPSSQSRRDQAVSLAPRTEAAVETAGRHGRRSSVEQAGGWSYSRAARWQLPAWPAEGLVAAAFAALACCRRRPGLLRGAHRRMCGLRRGSGAISASARLGRGRCALIFALQSEQVAEEATGELSPPTRPAPTNAARERASIRPRRGSSC